MVTGNTWVTGNAWTVKAVVTSNARWNDTWVDAIPGWTAKYELLTLQYGSRNATAMRVKQGGFVVTAATP